MENQKNKQTDAAQEQPPIFSSWNRLYSIVLLNLAFLIIIFYIFTKAFQ